jgi:hypothetical protein
MMKQTFSGDIASETVGSPSSRFFMLGLPRGPTALDPHPSPCAICCQPDLEQDQGLLAETQE